MSEIARMTPSQGEYKKEKYILWKESLEKTIEEVKNLSSKDVSERLKKYENTIPGATKENTFEMMALYQRALQLLWFKEIWITARFRTETFTTLEKAQSTKLGMKKGDGFPGPKTTKALIEALKKLDTPVQAKAVPTENGEKIKIDEIIGNAKKNSMISRMSSAESFYNGSSPALIDYAIIKQPDGEFFLYDKPSIDWIRTVYRTNNKYTMISSASVDKEWKITPISWIPINAPYMPTPVPQKQQ